MVSEIGKLTYFLPHFITIQTLLKSKNSTKELMDFELWEYLKNGAIDLKTSNDTLTIFMRYLLPLNILTQL